MLSCRRVNTFVTELSTPARFSEKTMIVKSFVSLPAGCFSAGAGAGVWGEVEWFPVMLLSVREFFGS